VAPRRVINSATGCINALMGRPLTQLLRWRQKDGDLHWACAA